MDLSAGTQGTNCSMVCESTAMHLVKSCTPAQRDMVKNTIDFCWFSVRYQAAIKGVDKGGTPI